MLKMMWLVTMAPPGFALYLLVIPLPPQIQILQIGHYWLLREPQELKVRLG